MEACWAHNPEVRGSKPRSAKYFSRTADSYAHWSLGVVVITSALHAEGRQFDPGTDHVRFGFESSHQIRHVRMAEWSKAPDSRLTPCPLIRDERRFLVLL